MAIFNGTPDNDTLNGTPLQDFMEGFAGDDTLSGLEGNDLLQGDQGNDILDGGFGGDAISGGRGNDTLEGAQGDDFMFGDSGDDVLAWDDGDGDDIMLGGNGYDTVEFDGAVAKADEMVLTQSDGFAFFLRPNLGPITLTIQDVEAYEVEGLGGDDSLTVKDLTGLDVRKVKFSGGEGNDKLDASASDTPVIGYGDAGDDWLMGGSAKDVLAGGDGIDTLTGNSGRDRFLFEGNVFANGIPGGDGNVKALNTPDIITDFIISDDKFALDASDLGIDQIRFREGDANLTSGRGSLGDGNVLVLTAGFSKATEAAEAIANNNNITAREGVFVYYNTGLGISRLVYSKDLANGGDISVLANLTNQAGAEGLANITDFSSKNFKLV